MPVAYAVILLGGEPVREILPAGICAGGIQQWMSLPRWRSVLLLEDESLDSFSTNAQPLQKIHTRMPVILLPETHERWLAGKEILLRFPVEAMKIRAVSARVNKPENNDPGLLERR